MSQPDEEAQYRQEVLSLHIPDEQEEWLRFESERLTQCTRIFPLAKRAGKEKDKGGDGERDVGEENEEELEIEEEDIGDKGTDKKKVDKDKEAAVVASNSNSNSNKEEKKKPASYEEILFQVFLQDKKQTMRLRCPLPSRVRPDDSNGRESFLPPLDPPTSSRSSMSTMVSAALTALFVFCLFDYADL
jgi:hypothetical protein